MTPMTGHVISASVGGHGRRLGDLLAVAGRPDEAVVAWREAQDRYAELGQTDMAAGLVSRIAEFIDDLRAPAPRSRQEHGKAYGRYRSAARG